MSRWGPRSIAVFYLVAILVGPLAVVFYRTFEPGLQPAWNALTTSGATHVLVHERAWLDDQGPKTTATLANLGAREIMRAGPDVLMQMP